MQGDAQLGYTPHPRQAVRGRQYVRGRQELGTNCQMQPFFLPCTNLDALGYTFHVAWICNALSLIPPHPPSHFSVYITFPNTSCCPTPLIDAPSPSRFTKLLIHAPSLARHVSEHDAVCVPAGEERQVLGGHRLGVEDLGMPGRREGGGGAKVWTCMYQLGKRARTDPAQECLGAGGGEEVWTRHYTGGKKCPLPPPPCIPSSAPKKTCSSLTSWAAPPLPCTSDGSEPGRHPPPPHERCSTDAGYILVYPQIS